MSKRWILMAGMACLLSAPAARAELVFDPLFQENFESAAEFGLPSGWTQYNETDYLEGSYVAGDTTNLANSEELMGWTVLTFESLGILGGSRTNNANVVQGKSVYAESDNRGGIQAQWLYTPVFNLSAADPVVLRFDSNYVQNQDSIAFAEYTLQGDLANDNPNKKWLPIFYWVNTQQVTDAAGDIDALLNNYGLNGDTNYAYSFYVGADPSLISFDQHILGLIDDNATESKGRKTYTLAQAAKQAKVQIRFFQGGGGSWYWGIDNFAVGSMKEQGAATPPAAPTLTSSSTNPTASTPLVLTTSAFSGSAGATHATTAWELSLDPQFGSLLYQTLTVAPNLTSLTVPAGTLPFGKTVYARAKYTDSAELASAYSNVVNFKMDPAPNTTVIFSEDFEGLTLNPFEQETTGDGTDFTLTPPAGWTVDNSLLPAGGMPEWAGWSFADRAAWASVDDQRRSEFTKGVGTVAVADSDEWDDAGHDAGNYNTYLSTPAISLSGVLGGKVYVVFDSSWRDEAAQGASLTASFDGKEPVEIFYWASDSADPNFKDDATNESLLYEVAVPAGSQNMILNFNYFDASNNWWWAFDNLAVFAEKAGTPVAEWTLF